MITYKALVHDTSTDTPVSDVNYGLQRFKNILYEAYCKEKGIKPTYIDGMDRNIRYPKLDESKMPLDSEYAGLYEFMRSYDEGEFSTKMCEHIARNFKTLRKHIADIDDKASLDQFLDTFNNAVENEGVVIFN